MTTLTSAFAGAVVLTVALVNSASAGPSYSRDLYEPVAATEQTGRLAQAPGQPVTRGLVLTAREDAAAAPAVQTQSVPVQQPQSQYSGRGDGRYTTASHHTYDAAPETQVQPRAKKSRTVHRTRHVERDSYATPVRTYRSHFRAFRLGRW